MNPPKIWVTTDWHLGHKNICEYSERPSTYEYLIRQGIKKNVAEDDLVINLGDLSFSPTKIRHNHMSLLPGNHILIRGNHDPKPNTYYMEYWGFKLSCEELTLEYKGKKFRFRHEPDNLHDNVPSDQINVYGHLHTNRPGDFGYVLNPAYDRLLALEGEYLQDIGKTEAILLNYNPISLDALL